MALTSSTAAVCPGDYLQRDPGRWRWIPDVYGTIFGQHLPSEPAKGEKNAVLGRTMGQISCPRGWNSLGTLHKRLSNKRDSFRLAASLAGECLPGFPVSSELFAPYSPSDGSPGASGSSVRAPGQLVGAERGPARFALFSLLLPQLLFFSLLSIFFDCEEKEKRRRKAEKRRNLTTKIVRKS